MESENGKRQKQLASLAPRTGTGRALGELAWTILDVYFHMCVPADYLTKLYRQSPPRYGMMRDLAVGGPTTVAQMARARALARQGVQRLADELTRDGLTEYLDNPAHRRSKLLRLTAKGWTVTRKIAAQEAVGWDRWAAGLKTGQLQVATGVLKELKVRFRRTRREERACRYSKLKR